MNETTNEYPELYQFLGGYMNSDFDLIAPTLEGVVLAFVSEAGGDAARCLRADIARFVTSHQRDLDAELWRRFPDHAQEPDQSACEFLAWLDGAVARASPAG